MRKTSLSNFLPLFRTRNRQRTRVRAESRRKLRSELLEERRLLSADFQLLRDIHPGSASALDNANNSNASEYSRIGDQVIFEANDGQHGTELWTSDGTSAGTKLLKDLNPGPSSGLPSNLTVVGNEIYFTANRSVHGNDAFELWKTDGTTAGTTRIDTIAIDRYDSHRNFMAVDVQSSPTPKLFFTNDDGVSGRELWVSDGTRSGRGSSPT